jgi:hypothetical protein
LPPSLQIRKFWLSGKNIGLVHFNLYFSSHLITALIEPAKETTRALTIIVNTRFIHVMDAPALALMMPILKRALNDRESDGRKMASQVITNLFAISEEKVNFAD